MKINKILVLLMFLVLLFSTGKIAFAGGDDTCGTRSISGTDSCTMLNGTRGICNKNSGDTKNMCYAATSASTVVNGGTAFKNPLAFDNVESLLSNIMGAVQKIIVVLALVFIVIGALMILTSAGNSGMVEKGKGAITMALVGLALGVAAPSLLKELSIIIGWNDGAADPALSGALTLSAIAMNVLNFLLGIAGVLALVMLVIGAILYLTSAGDEDRIEKGKEIFKYSLMGLLLAMASMILVKQIAFFFAGSSSVPTSSVSTPAPVITAPTLTQMPQVPNVSAPWSQTSDTCQTKGGSANEVCIDMPKDPNSIGVYYMPSGMDCKWRNVCPNDPMQACCKPL